MNKYNLKPIVILAVITALIGANISLLAQFSGGGTALSPYLILSRADMDTLAKYVEEHSAWTANKHFKLMLDIGSLSDPWTNIIGVSSSDNSHIFQGHLDGNNRKIYLNISNITSGKTGLFNQIVNGSIKKLIVEGNVVGTSIVGGIVGEMKDGNLDSCVNKSNVSSQTGAVIGGIVGHFYNENVTAGITNCKDSGSVSGYSNVGGIAGQLDGYPDIATGIQIHITNCYNFGTVTATENCGGIVGLNLQKGRIISCVNLGKINCATSVVGGIVGLNQSRLMQTLNLGVVGGNSVIGGICGKNESLSNSEPAEITNCMNAGIVSGNSVIGGICGNQSIDEKEGNTNGNASINYSLNVGAVEGAGTASGILGERNHTENNIVISCYYDKQFTMFGGIANSDIIDAAEGKNTSELIGTALNGIFSGAGWIFTAGKYPRVTSISSSNYAIVASAPANLDVSNTRLTLNKHFTVNAADGVNWNTTFNKLSITNGNVTLLLTNDDTLICSKGDAKKRIPINILSIPSDKSFEVVVEAWPEDGGIVSGGGIYSEKDSAIITAEANPHYTFSHWEELPSGVQFSSDAIDTIEVVRNYTFRAHFIIDSFMLTLTPNPATMGACVGDGIYPYGKIVQFWATPNYGYHFVKWTDENNEIFTDSIMGKIEILEDRHLTAHFEIDTFNIKVSVEPSNSGIATVNEKEEGDYIYLTKVNLATEGYDTCNHFVKWTAFGDTTTISTDPNFNLTLISDTHVVARYTETNRYLVLQANIPEAVIEFTGAGAYPCNPTIVDVDFIMADGYKFVNWTEAETGEVMSVKKDFKIEVVRNYTLIANFISDTVPKFILNIISVPDTGGITTGTGIYDPDELVTIEAIPNTDNGFRFVNWRTENGDLISNQAVYSFNITQDTTLIANFANSYILSTSVLPNNEAGNITGTINGIYSYNTPVSLEANVKDPTIFEFKNWKNTTGDILSTNIKFDFLLTKDTNIIAEFDFTSIKELSDITSFNLSPNPATDKFVISMKLSEAANSINISLLDMQGNNVMQINNSLIPEGMWQKEIKVLELPSATYILKIVIGNNVYAGKIIIQK